jgi:hypothetical protein
MNDYDEFKTFTEGSSGLGLVDENDPKLKAELKAIQDRQYRDSYLKLKKQYDWFLDGYLQTLKNISPKSKTYKQQVEDVEGRIKRLGSIEDFIVSKLTSNKWYSGNLTVVEELLLEDAKNKTIKLS